MTGKDSKKVRVDGRATIGYGVKVPIISFEEAVGAIEKTGRQAGMDGTLDDLSKILGNTRTSSTFILKTRVLRSFDLISVSEENYHVTSIGQSIIQPISPGERERAKFQAFLNHEVLKSLFENYKGKLLPQREYLGNFIRTSLKIPDALRLEWADYFLKAAEYVGLLHHRENGALQVMAFPSVSGEITAAVQGEENKPEQTTTKEGQAPRPIPSEEDGLASVVSRVQWGILNQRTLSSNRRAIFAIPDELTDGDIQALRQIIKGIEAGLDGLRKIDEDKE